jgi:ABC-2 type transport system ATP-binding protein
MGNAMIELQHVTKLYGSVIGVNDVSSSLARGAYGLLGPNGSGKSTLLNLLTGQLRPTLGTIRVLGHRPWNSRELFQRIGVCPEQEVLYADVSGFEWVRYLLQLHGYDRRQAATLARQALEQVGLAESMYRRMGGYSRGMRQRAKLAQAFAHDPELLILDEPFNGVDPIGRHQMTELLRQWIASGKGVLLASHILHEVEAITDSFLLICGGRLLASGSAEEVHALLTDVPNEIRIRCDGASRLAARLVDEGLAEAIRFEEEGRVLTISTRSPATIYTQLPAWIEGSDVHVEELHSKDDSLQALFNSLLQIHRGKR